MSGLEAQRKLRNLCASNRGRSGSQCHQRSWAGFPARLFPRRQLDRVCSSRSGKWSGSGPARVRCRERISHSWWRDFERYFSERRFSERRFSESEVTFITDRAWKDDFNQGDTVVEQRGTAVEYNRLGYVERTALGTWRSTGTSVYRFRTKNFVIDSTGKSGTCRPDVAAEPQSPI